MIYKQDSIKNALKKYFKVTKLLDDSDGAEDIYSLAHSIIYEKLKENVTGELDSDSEPIIEDIAYNMRDEVYEAICEVLNNVDEFKCFSFCKNNREFFGDCENYFKFYYLDDVKFETVLEFCNYFGLHLFDEVDEKFYY